MATDLGVSVTTEGKYYFISYNTEDAELVSSYLKKMTDYGLPVWYDYGIPQGEEWERIIAEKIRDCESVIMFISSKLFKKEKSFVKKEWNIAKRRNKKVYLVILDRIDEDSIPPRYDFWWSDIKDTQSIQAYTMELDACVDKILDAVGFEKQINPLNQIKNQTEVDFSQYPDFVIEEGVLKEYKGNDSVVKIPYGVTSIGNNAFDGCDSLTSVIIPNSVTKIGENAFSFCRSLISIDISDGVTSIGESAFFNCDSLISIIIPDSVTSIGNFAFGYCHSLTSIVIPENVTSIDYGPLSCCDSLVYISVSAGNQNYKDIDGNLYTKDGSTFIQYAIGKTDTTFNIPESVTKIGESAFSGCDSLTSIVTPEGVTSIGKGAFSSCSSLTSIVIPNSVTSIGYGAFYICSSLTSVVIGDSVTSIGDLVFSWCKSLTSIEIPDSVTSIGDYAFYCCTSLTDVYYAGSESDWKQISIGSFNNGLTGATIHYNYIP